MPNSNIMLRKIQSVSSMQFYITVDIADLINSPVFFSGCHLLYCIQLKKSHVCSSNVSWFQINTGLLLLLLQTYVYAWQNVFILQMFKFKNVSNFVELNIPKKKYFVNLNNVWCQAGVWRISREKKEPFIKVVLKIHILRIHLIEARKIMTTEIDDLALQLLCC